MINTITRGTAAGGSDNPPVRSVLKSLRDLMPARVLSYAEALQRAELQANRLLALHEVAAPVVPIEIVSELPRVRIVQGFDLPVSGSAHWDGTYWVISLNASEYDLRRRFSLMHEFKHVLDHPTRHLIRGDRQAKLDADAMAEKVADYFAACVLMPKAWVKSAFCSRTQNIERLADRFQVSPKAMSFRLSQLGLTMPADRCAPGAHMDRGGFGGSWSSTGYTPRSSRRRRYFRSLSTSLSPTFQGHARTKQLVLSKGGSS